MTTLRRDQVVVVDIEATCWKANKQPPDQHNEIIEVGICLLNVASGESSQKRSILIKPTRSRVSAFCTKLTSLTQEQVDAGVTFQEACAIIQREYATRQRLWCSWGNYDRRMFIQQCEDFNVPYPFSDQHFNLKALFAEVRNNGERIGLMRALKSIGVPVQGRAHRGHDDAWNASRVLAHLLNHYGPVILEPYW